MTTSIQIYSSYNLLTIKVVAHWFGTKGNRKFSIRTEMSFIQTLSKKSNKIHISALIIYIYLLYVNMLLSYTEIDKYNFGLNYRHYL